MEPANNVLETLPEETVPVPQEPELNPEKSRVRLAARRIGAFLFTMLTEAEAEGKGLVDAWKVLLACLLLFNVQIKAKAAVDKREGSPARQTFFISIGQPLQMSSFSLPVNLGLHFKGLSWNARRAAQHVFADNALSLAEEIALRL